MRRSRPIAVFDLLACLLLVWMILALASRPTQTPPSPTTEGRYALTMTWSQSNHDDVDLYVADPEGNVAWFGNLNADYVNLEHDDTGTPTTSYDGQTNIERAIIRRETSGEYTVNVHMYNLNQAGPVVITVTLWKLFGQPAQLLQRQVVLRYQGQESTAFRFRLHAGRLASWNDLPRHLLVTDTANPGATGNGITGG